MANVEHCINNIFVEDEPYLMLDAAILKQAVYDLKKAIKNGNNAEAKALKKWFLSDYGQLLSFGKGQYYIDLTERIISEESK